MNDELQRGDRVTINDFGVPRSCVVDTMPREAALRPDEWDPDRLHLVDPDGRYFPLDMPRWEVRR
jgi:hypothetical protein